MPQSATEATEACPECGGPVANVQGVDACLECYWKDG